jgi:drug/metabolite transporter (DMT)-like permease
MAGWAGVAMISAGVLALALPAGWWGGSADGRADGRAAAGAGSALALATAVVIAAYTLGDGAGVRRSGAAIGYTLWIFLLTAPPVLLWSFLIRGRPLAGAVAARWRGGLAGAIGTMTSYGIALWAMTEAPVAMVAALRETSILFAIAISALVLGEGIGPRRITAALAIALGAGLLRLA